ncbi:hypothetical protein [Mycobacteroides franklinii]|uniref:hypothetical protein n=1 Tax=Mycobacteroides franklinii TaxID=948102 RepID=UPI0009922D56|nr:hypothetical protein [Mycobacteroides franklinii]
MTELNPSEAQRKKMAHGAATSAANGWSDNVRDWLPIVDRMVDAANNLPKGAPVGTIARRPDGAWLACRYANLNGKTRWNYFRVDYDAPFHSPGDADSWPVIYDPTKPDFNRLNGTDKGAVGFITGLSDERLEELGGFPDQTAQQEPAPDFHESVREVFDVRGGKSPRTPRVVDRLGVEHQGSRWRANSHGREVVFRYSADHWVYQVNGGSHWYPMRPGETPHIWASYTEILEPRVLPTLEVEEARDGTVWRDRDGDRCQYRDGLWRFVCDGPETWPIVVDGGRLTEFGPYTEVIS